MRETNRTRRRLLAALLTGAALPIPTRAEDGDTPEALRNPLLWAVAWKQTAAEYRALCYQAWNVARLLIERALAERDERPLCVIMDVDDTVLHAGSYWGYLVAEDRDFFDDAIWDAWIPQNLATPVPGALDFCRYCESNGVEIFYVTSRDQGRQTYQHARTQLQALGFPRADDGHLTVLRETSDKSATRERIAQTHRVVLLVGDNLNDYKRDYYLQDVDERLSLVDRDREDYGRTFIVLPNPTDGHWVRAIFGESEPAPTDANRRLLRAAATRGAW
ncbi:MAG: 5'-nucleotidase, lipoprotein e(P4) family, partial [Woeseiaceae bacterium]